MLSIINDNRQSIENFTKKPSWPLSYFKLYV